MHLVRSLELMEVRYGGYNSRPAGRLIFRRNSGLTTVRQDDTSKIFFNPAILSKFCLNADIHLFIDRRFEFAFNSLQLGPEPGDKSSYTDSKSADAESLSATFHQIGDAVIDYMTLPGAFNNHTYEHREQYVDLHSLHSDDNPPYSFKFSLSPEEYQEGIKIPPGIIFHLDSIRLAT